MVVWNGKEVYYCLIGVTKSWYQNWSQKFTYWFAVLWTALHEQNSCKSHLLGRILGIRWFSESSLLISMLISVSSRFSALLLGHEVVVIPVGRSASSCVDIRLLMFSYLTIIGDHIFEWVRQFFKMFCSEYTLDCWKILHVVLSMWKK